MMITCTLDPIPGLKQFRIVQERADSITSIIAKGKDFEPETVLKVEMQLKKLLGEDMHIRCEVVENINREPSGKVRAVISRLS